MAKYIFLVLIMILTVQFAGAQDHVRELDRKTDKPILRGKLTFKDIMKESTCSWFEEGVEAYTPNAAAIEELSTVWKNYRFVVFMGTWCEDTRNLLPKFYKVLLDANISMDAIVVYGVNRAKQSLQDEQKFYKITNVPTIIVLHQKREVGRIVENVNTTVEEELAVMMDRDAKELEIKKAEQVLKFEDDRQKEINSMKPRIRKRYFATRSFY